MNATETATKLTSARPRPLPWLELRASDTRDAILQAGALEQLMAALRTANTPIPDSGPGVELLRALHVDRGTGKAILRIEVPVRPVREDPKFLAESPMSRVTSDERNALAHGEFKNYAQLARLRWLATAPRWVDLDSAGLAELHAANAETARRRSVATDEDEADRLAAEGEKVRAAEREAARQEHQRRQLQWGRLSREQQVFLAGAADRPEYAPLLERLAELAAGDRVAMPPSWRP